METAEKKSVAIPVLLILNGLAVIGLLVAILLCLPYFDPAEPTPAVLATEPSTVPETTVDTTPTLPPPAANPYGRNDFQYEGDWLLCQAGRSIPGIDVSAHQGKIDWQAVADSGIRFVMVRLGYRGWGEKGTLKVDEYAVANIKGAQEAGLAVGAYFFSQSVTEEEAIEEANMALEILGDLELQLPIVYDWEYVSEEARTANMDARTLTDMTIAFCETIEGAGRDSMIYFNWGQADDLMYLEELVDYPFWLALWQDRMTYPYRVEMWQYTSTGRVPGIVGDVDINIGFQ